jgi:hypothetical protein
MEEPMKAWPRSLSFLVVACLAVLAWTELAAAAPATRVNVMPNRQARPAVAVVVWGNSGAGGAVGDGSSNGETYTWSFAPNPDVTISDDGSLTGLVANDRFIAETVTFTLAAGVTRTTVNATLNVSGISKSVAIDVVDPLDPISDTPLEALAVDVNIAIENGLRAMYTSQRPDGRWRHSDGFDSTADDCGTTGFSIWAFANSGHTPLKDPNTDIYAEWVQKAIDWVFTVSTTPGGFNPSGPAGEQFNPDANGNGRIIALCGNDGYSTPMAGNGLIAAYGTSPATLVAGGPFAGETYGTVIADAVEWSHFAQSDCCTSGPAAGGTEGGWRYSANGGADTSVDSWHYVFSEGYMSVLAGTVNETVKKEAERRLDQSQMQTAPIGRFGYGGGVPAGTDGNATTAGGLSGLNFVSFGGRSGFYLDGGGSLVTATFPSIASRKAAAVTHIGNRWDDAPGVWAGNRGNFYAMWTTARALRLNGTTTLVKDAISFDWQTGEEGGGGNVPGPGATREGYFPYLVRTQAADGHWAPTVNTGNWTQNLNTAWGVLVLQPTVFGPPQPEEIPLFSQPNATFTLYSERPGVPDDSFHEVAEFDIPDGVSFDPVTEGMIVELSNPACNTFSMLTFEAGDFKSRGGTVYYFTGNVVDDITGDTPKVSIRVQRKVGTRWVASFDYAKADFTCLEGSDDRSITLEMTIGDDTFRGEQCFGRLSDGDLFYPKKGASCGP